MGSGSLNGILKTKIFSGSLLLKNPTKKARRTELFTFDKGRKHANSPDCWKNVNSGLSEVEDAEKKVVELKSN